MEKNRKKVLIVGAGGFVGGFIADEGLRRGFDIYAGVRRSTSLKYLPEEAKTVFLTFDEPEKLAGELRAALPEGERWDYIIYNLGATKAISFTDFNTVNYEYLRYFTGALKRAGMMPERLLYMSSLSVMGPGDERTYAPFTEERTPIPNTRYGTSKLKAELWLQTAGIPYVIFRATGVYGPRERDYYLMFKSIESGVDFSVGMRRQSLTFIYVDDLVRAMYDALERAPADSLYLISEPRSYSQKEFRHMAQKALGKRAVFPLRLPLWTAGAACAVIEWWNRRNPFRKGPLRPTTLNRDKYKIMRQRNWNVDVSKAQREFGFDPQVSLEEGIRRSVEWYRENKWL